MSAHWAVCLLSDVVRFGNGKAIKPGGTGMYPVFGSNGIIGGSDEFIHENGVVIGRVGAYCGAVVYCPTKFWASDNTLVAYPSSEQVDTQFLYYLLVDANLSRYAGGAAQPLVTQTVLKQVEVRIPVLGVQLRIAGILSAYDELIENSQRRIKTLEAMASSIYREWFVYFRFPGHESVSLVPSVLGDIPQGWEVKKLKDMCRLTMGQSPKSEFYNETGEGIAFHQGVTDFGDRFPSDRLFCTTDGRIAEVGDILFSVRAPVGRLNIANKKICLGRGLSAIRHNQNHQVFLWEQLRNRFTKDDMMGNGAIFASVTKDDMQGIELVCPSDSVVRDATKNIEPLHTEIATLSLQVQNIRHTRDILLTRLLSGQIEVEAIAS
jgi:type I restriction enzyme S subunit